MTGVARISPRQIIDAALRDRRRKLEALAASQRKRGLRVSCVVEWDHPEHEAVVRYVLAARPDLLVAETSHHNRLVRWILSNTDWELIRSCPCPLWLVRSGTLPKKPVENFGGTISIIHADSAQDSRIDAVERLARRFGVPPANRYVFPGEATRVLPEAVGRVGADILLLGAVSRSRLEQPFIGTTAERVIDRVECDVFVVKPVGYRSPVSRRRPRLPA